MLPAKATLSPGFIVLYRWRLHPDGEDAFVEGWARISELLLARGSLGSRLHRGADGLWYSYAQWPDSAAREAASDLGAAGGHAVAQMQSAIAERFPEIILEPVADFLVHSGLDDAAQRS